MRISERQFGAARVFDFQGPLVGSDARVTAEEALERHVQDARTGPELIVVNLARVADVDCDGMSVLGRTERVLRRKGGALRVALPADGRRPLMTRRIRTFFDSFDSVEDALADLRASMARGRQPAGGRIRRQLRRVTLLRDRFVGWLRCARDGRAD